MSWLSIGLAAEDDPTMVSSVDAITEATIDLVRTENSAPFSLPRSITNAPKTSSDTQRMQGAAAIAILNSVSISPAPMQQQETQPVPTTVVKGKSAERRLTPDWLAVNYARLDTMRGGFDTESGVRISFGIQRAVYINGSLVTTTSFNLPDVSKLTGEQARVFVATAGTVNLIQNGRSNTFQPGPSSQFAAAMVVQNTLNNQNIKSLTIIDATANSLAVLKSLNLQSVLKDGLVNSVGVR